jgi:hypothetical protein
MGRAVGYVPLSTAGLKLPTAEEAKVTGHEEYAKVCRTGMLMNEFSTLKAALDE